MWSDLRYAIRALRRAPGYTAVTALTIALGIGANTAIFSVVHGVLLKPLGYRDPSRLVRLSEGRPGFPVSYPNFLDWRARARTFEDLAIYNPSGRAIVAVDGRAESEVAGTAEGRLFVLLGAQPVRGRLFTPEEETRGGPGAVLISHALWQRRFAASETIVGSAVTIGAAPTIVAGVLPPGFGLDSVDVWYPLAPTIGAMQLDRRNRPGFQAVARLRDGVEVEQAQQEMAAIGRDLEQQYPESNYQKPIVVLPLLETMVGQVRPMLLLLAGAVGFLLLIACANVANVLLARGLQRGRETAVRAALGAGRARLVRLFLFESGVIAALGGAGGVLLAAWVVRGFRALPGFAIPRAASVSVDPVVLLFAFALAAATAIVFGLAPALQVTRVHLMSGLRQAGAAAGAPAGGRRLRGLLVGVEVALSLMLLAGAGLMVRTLANLASVDLGFRPEGVMTLSTQQPGSRYGEIELRRRFAAQALERIGSRPGVASAALAWPMDLVGFSWSPYARFRDRPAPSGREPAVQLAVVSPSYFETMGIPLKRGRVFGPGDRAGAPVVAIVNETVVRNLLPAGDPVGRRLSIVGIPELADLEIVGVAGDTLRRGPAARAFFEVYCAYEQFPASNPVMIVRAAAGDPLPLVRSVQDGLASVDPTVATYNPRRLEDVMAARVGDRRLLTRLLGLFAGLALLLTAAGIGSVVSFVVAQRTQELGVRMALGADGGALIRMVLRGAMIPVAAGLAAGLAASVPLAPTVQRYLFQVTPADPIALAGGALVLVATAMLAAYVPARRATRIDPVVALRQT